MKNAVAKSGVCIAIVFALIMAFQNCSGMFSPAASSSVSAISEERSEPDSLPAGPVGDEAGPKTESSKSDDSSLNPPIEPVRYFGYYGSAMTGAGSRDGNFMAETSDHTNLVWIAPQGLDDAIGKLTQARALKKRAVLVVNQQFFDDVRTPILHAEQVRRWEEFARGIRPYLSTIVAFYPIDEPYLKIREREIDPGYFKTYLESVADVIRASFPATPIAVIQSYEEILMGYVPPANFDWYGIDCYGSWDSCGDGLVGRRSIPWYYAKLSTWIGSEKKFLLVPDANVPREAFDAKTEDALIVRLAQYKSLADSEPRVVAITAFLYQSICDLPFSAATRFDFFDTRNRACFRGVSALPKLLEEYRAFGKSYARPSAF